MDLAAAAQTLALATTAILTLLAARAYHVLVWRASREPSAAEPAQGRMLPAP